MFTFSRARVPNLGRDVTNITGRSYTGPLGGWVVNTGSDYYIRAEVNCGNATPSYSSLDEGTITPTAVNKLAVPAPYLALIAVAVVATVYVVKRRRRA